MKYISIAGCHGGQLLSDEQSIGDDEIIWQHVMGGIPAIFSSLHQ